jgi:hypothetical protein
MTQIRLSFYGLLGSGDDRTAGEERYRAPEMLYGAYDLVLTLYF